MITFWAIVSLVIVHLSAPFAGDAATTMADIELYMNSLKGLPDYCQCRLAEAKFREEFMNKYRPAQIDWPAQFAKVRDRWAKPFGKNWNHIHHYCFGIQKLNRVPRTTGSYGGRSKKDILLEAALEEFEYMRRRADRSFPLWSQLFMYEYQIYFQLGEPAKAQRAMQQAVKYQKRRKSRR